MSAAAPTGAPAAGPPSVPSVRRRLVCLLYEGILLFAVVTIAALVFSLVMQQRHALTWRGAAMAFLFVVMGLYFTWCWRRGGQTLAMQTWHIRVQTTSGEPLSMRRALARYVCAYVWMLPPLALVAVNGLDAVGVGGATAIVLAWVLGYGLASRAHPDRQFWHDALCGTRLVTHRPVRPPKTTR